MNMPTKLSTRKCRKYKARLASVGSTLTKTITEMRTIAMKI